MSIKTEFDHKAWRIQTLNIYIKCPRKLFKCSKELTLCGIWESSQLKDVIKEVELVINQKSVCKGRSRWELGLRGLPEIFFCCCFKDTASLCGPGHPATRSIDKIDPSQNFTCLCLPDTGIKGMHYHTRLAKTFLTVTEIT